MSVWEYFCTCLGTAVTYLQSASSSRANFFPTSRPRFISRGTAFGIKQGVKFLWPTFPRWYCWKRRMSNGLFEVIFGLRFSLHQGLYWDLLTRFTAGPLRGISTQQVAGSRGGIQAAVTWREKVLHPIPVQLNSPGMCISKCNYNSFQMFHICSCSIKNDD